MKRFVSLSIAALFIMASCSPSTPDNPNEDEPKNNDKEEVSFFANTVWGIEEGREWSGIPDTYYARIFDNEKSGRVIQWKNGEILNEYRSFDYVFSTPNLTCTDHLQSGSSMTFHYTVSSSGDSMSLDNGDVWHKLK